MRPHVAAFPILSRDGERLVFMSSRSAGTPREQDIFLCDVP